MKSHCAAAPALVAWYLLLAELLNEWCITGETCT
jgi:hypothetical protein